MVFRYVIKLFCIFVVCIPGFASATQNNLVVNFISTDTSWSGFKNQFADTSLDNMNDSGYNKTKHISVGQYVAGGVLGTVLGLGMGHAVQGRYGEKGWAFTVLKSGSIIAAFAFAAGESKGGVVLSLITLFGISIWELIDVWWLPSSYKVGQHKNNNNFYVTPVLYSYNDSLRPALGVSVGFKW